LLLNLGIPAILLTAVWAGGSLFALGGPIGGFSAGNVVVVQTNVEPARDWTRAYTDRQILAHLEATEAALGSLAPRWSSGPKMRSPGTWRRSPCSPPS
jgi:apolipoprotein N-acyltransferase